MPLDLEPLAPKDALAFFRSKGFQTSFDYRDVWQAEHARAYTVAKMMNRDLLEETRAINDQSIAEGWTYDQFRRALKPKLQAAGWWGKQLMGDPATGEIKLVQLGSDRRLRTIFNTNARVAYAAGNWSRIERNKVALPWLVYWTKEDERVRPEHAAWHLVCLSVDDPWWDTHFPPCGWGCRCDTRSFSQRMLEDRKIEVTKTPPKFPLKTYINPRTGEVTEVETGIDPSWNYNVGKAPLRPLTARPLPPPPGATTKLTEEEVNDRINAALDQLGGSKARVMQDRDGWPIVAGRDLFRDPDGRDALPRPDLIEHLPAVVQALKKPDELEWLWAADPRVPTMYPPDPVAAIGDVVTGRATQVTYQPVRPWLAELAAREAGLKLEKASHAIDQYAVNHILKSHGDPAVESLRGQIAITPAMVGQVGRIVSAPDFVGLGSRNAKNLDVVVYAKRDMLGTYIYVEELRRRQLMAVTLFRGAATIDVRKAMQTADPNVLKHDGGYTLKIIDVSQSIKPPPAAPKMRLVRRYTLRLDDKIVTVDFSGDTWTFDVQPVPAS
ncbi:phage minor head protein [Asticcacaulis sp. YBE204]|uniref:phage minor head protein n=1 Tax=Asticcacaulis sp. YBE204 TaxID=1282363 RepID=UPI0003C3B44B|nr:phage minor head protein [Asticcacaulis sp. YBE204]ESQ78446.1 F protein [Asticcacaulis sp. YBE204]